MHRIYYLAFATLLEFKVHAFQAFHFRYHSPSINAARSSTSDDEHEKSNILQTDESILEENSNDPESSNSNQNDWKKLKVPPPYMFQAKNEVVGIGGKSGYTYDVNRLKSNLVQKSVRQFKKELLMLLIGSESGAYDTKNSKRKSIEDKIAALVSANPVGTTTDSNLLEGRWEYAFSTNNAISILDESRISGIKRDSGAFVADDMAARKGPWRISWDKIENPLHSLSRVIVLEELDDDESPFLLDSISFFRGIWVVKREYQVIGLTRKMLHLQPTSRSVSLFGTSFRTKIFDTESVNIPKFELQIIYLDSDIMMCMVGGDQSNLAIFTKNENWIAARNSNTLGSMLSYITSFESPLHLRQNVSRLLRRKRQNLSDVGVLTEEEYKKLFLSRFTDPESTLTALRLGEYKLNEEEFAWEGKDDPFVTLTADERQELLKKMSIGEIKKAGSIQTKLQKTQKIRMKRKSFIRPRNKN